MPCSYYMHDNLGSESDESSQIAVMTDNNVIKREGSCCRPPLPNRPIRSPTHGGWNENVAWFRWEIEIWLTWAETSRSLLLPWGLFRGLNEVPGTQKIWWRWHAVKRYNVGKCWIGTGWLQCTSRNEDAAVCCAYFHPLISLHPTQAYMSRVVKKKKE